MPTIVSPSTARSALMDRNPGYANGAARTDAGAAAFASTIVFSTTIAAGKKWRGMANVWVANHVASAIANYAMSRILITRSGGSQTERVRAELGASAAGVGQFQHAEQHILELVAGDKIEGEHIVNGANAGADISLFAAMEGLTGDA